MLLYACGRDGLKLMSRLSPEWEKSLRYHYNQFWESAIQFHLEPLLKKIYASSLKRKLINKWLGKSGGKLVLCYQLDFESDPLVIELRKGGYNFYIEEVEKLSLVPSVILVASHSAFISEVDSLGSLLGGMITGQVKLPILWKKLRDHIYAMLVFLL